jgi:hypothetical protein
MSITELIAHLNQIKEEKGDLEVILEDWDGYSHELSNLDYYDEDSVYCGELHLSFDQ